MSDQDKPRQFLRQKQAADSYSTSESDSDGAHQQQQHQTVDQENTTPSARASPQLTKKPSTVSTIRAGSQADVELKKPPPVNSGNMTVETETVSAVPTVAVSSTASNANIQGSLNATPANNNSVNTLPSNATASSTTASNTSTNITNGGSANANAANTSNASNSIRVKKSTDNVANKGLSRTKKKKSSRLAAGGGNSKAEIFAAKIASAVDEADSSDSDETFVYESSSHNDSSNRPRFHRNLSSSSIQPPQLPSATASATALPAPPSSTAPPQSQPSAATAGNAGVQQKETTAPTTGINKANSLPVSYGNAYRNNSFSSPRFSKATPATASQKSPFLRATSSRYFEGSNPGNNKLHRWRSGSYADDDDEDEELGEGGEGDIDDDDEYVDYSETTPLRPNNSSGYRSIRRARKNGGLVVYSPHNYRRKSPSLRYYMFRRFLWMTLAILCILGAGFVLGFLLASSKPLDTLEVEEIFDIIISDQELAFDMSLEAINPGFLAVDIFKTDLDVFARSPYAKDEPDEALMDDASSSHTLLLGNVQHFNAPVTFEGGFFNKVVQSAVGDVKLMNPGKNVTDNDDDDDDGGANRTLAQANDKSPYDSYESNNENDLDSGQKKWVRLSSHPFDLIVRGILRYDLLFGRGQRTVSVVKSVHVDPNIDLIAQPQPQPSP
jgi:hypothetical protein